jgi:8-oxo-dGTP diphosphatase
MLPARQARHVLSSSVTTSGSGPFPLSAKGIVLRLYADGGYRVLLARNDRNEWELPGGRPEPGESEAEAVVREVREETGQLVEAGPLVSRFELEISQAGVTVRIAAYGCHLVERRPLRLSPEHGQLAWLPTAELPDSVPVGYADAIARWARASPELARPR